MQVHSSLEDRSGVLPPGSAHLSGPRPVRDSSRTSTETNAASTRTTPTNVAVMKSWGPWRPPRPTRARSSPRQPEARGQAVGAAEVRRVGGDEPTGREDEAADAEVPLPGLDPRPHAAVAREVQQRLAAVAADPRSCKRMRVRQAIHHVAV